MNKCFTGQFVTRTVEEKPCKECGGAKFNLNINCPACPEHFHDFESLHVHFDSNRSIEPHAEYDPYPEMSNDVLSEALECTIKKDRINKCIVFKIMLNAQTEEDQATVMFSGDSSTGKSYIALEIASYFPENEVIKLASASPTSMVHESGVEVIEDVDDEGNKLWVPFTDYTKHIQDQIEEIEFLPKKSHENIVYLKQLKRQLFQLHKQVFNLVDYEGKIVIFIDQANYQLMEKIRPFISHDDKELHFNITDKNKGSGIRTKKVILYGYASVFFCTTNPMFDNQESTRCFVLSPEDDPDKTEQAIKLLSRKLADRKLFREWLNRQPKRKSLMFRIELIRAYNIKYFKIEDGLVYSRFNELHSGKLIHRNTRDFARIHSLVYGNTLLNCFNRVLDDDCLVATTEDIDSAFDLYKEIMESNESGLSPEIYNMYRDVIVPYYHDKAMDPEYNGMNSKDIMNAFFEKHGYLLSYKRLTEQILPALRFTSKLEAISNPNDKRETLYVPTIYKSLKPKIEQKLVDFVPTPGYISPGE